MGPLMPSGRGVLMRSFERSHNYFLHPFLQALDTAGFPVGKGGGADTMEAHPDTRARVARKTRNWSGVVSSFSLAGSRGLQHFHSTSARNGYSRGRGGASSPRLARGASALALGEMTERERRTTCD